MSMQDPIADMLTRIRNAAAVCKNSVDIPFSKIKRSIANVLKDEGYIIDFQHIDDTENKPVLRIRLKYTQGRSVISQLDRASRPGLRVYKSSCDIPKVKNGLGVSIVSTSKGVVSDKKARRLNVGGEVLCFVS